MSRPRAGYIGFNRVPAASAINSAASGVWTVREAESLKRAGTWPNAPVLTTVTGGTITAPGDGYQYHTFTSSGTLVVAGGPLICEVLVVGAGGSGSRARSGGGGGGGGVLYQLNQSIAVGSYAVTVAGTATRTNSGSGATGGPSSIASLYVATGGGGGISNGNYRHTGGTSGHPTATSNSVGNAGGTGSDCNESLDSGGGGGGAGGVGSNAPCTASAAGGAGRTVFGVTYGAGGRGGSEGLSARADGTANRGEGGSGGQNFWTNTAGDGGSGIVIVRYLV